ncbi:MAG: 50S ribosomal protein L1 [bacterium]
MTKEKTEKIEKTAVLEKETAVKEEIKELELDKATIYPIQEAIQLVKKLSKTKFDASVEAHFKLGIDPRKGDQQIRAAISLPHGTGKSIKIAAFVTPGKEQVAKDAGADYVGGEDLIEQIRKTEKTDFQIAVAEPILMKDLAKIAKILGTRGLMPSPKNETVTPNPAKAIEELKKGKISFKNDDTANVHVIIGKVSFTDEQLIENFKVIVSAIIKAKPAGSKGTYLKNISICSSMSPGVKVAQ